MRFDGLRLYSAPASFGQSSAADPVAPGRSLGVSCVVKGSVRSDDATVRVGAQLANAQTGEVIRSETADGALNPVALLAVQAELAAGRRRKRGRRRLWNELVLSRHRQWRARQRGRRPAGAGENGGGLPHGRRDAWP